MADGRLILNLFQSMISLSGIHKVVNSLNAPMRNVKTLKYVQFESFPT